MGGHGRVELVPAGWLTGGAPHTVNQSGVVVNMNARGYFAEQCTAGVYDHRQYLPMHMLGKRFSYTTDIAGAGCGCNVAFYLTSMRQNTWAGDCGDYYCDANYVCGVNCAEIDVQESNIYSWHSTLHGRDDSGGKSAGYGGGGHDWNGPRHWNSSEYGPAARCINTNRPFRVAVAFPTNDAGRLAAMEVELTQDGQPCSLSVRLAEYQHMEELSDALAAGMTPVLSYWSSSDMLWMDGLGMDQQGPCHQDNPATCATSAAFVDFVIEDIDATSTTTSTTPTAPTEAPIPENASVPGRTVLLQLDDAEVPPDFLTGTNVTIAWAGHTLRAHVVEIEVDDEQPSAPAPAPAAPHSGGGNDAAIADPAFPWVWTFVALVLGTAFGSSTTLCCISDKPCHLRARNVPILRRLCRRSASVTALASGQSGDGTPHRLNSDPSIMSVDPIRIEAEPVAAMLPLPNLMRAFSEQPKPPRPPASRRE